MKLHGKGQTRLPSKAVAQFPGIVPGNQKANLQKASRWWKERAQHTAKKRKSVVKVQCGVKKRMRLKAASGRGRKRAPWVEWLYSEMLGEFCRLRKTGVKLSRGLLHQIAIHILSTSSGQFRATTIGEKGEMLKDRVCSRWIQHFCSCFDILSRKQCGKLECSPEKEVAIERSVAAHLGKLKRAFDNGELNEDTIFNMDEAHFVINMDNKKTLGFRGDKTIRYHDMVSGGRA
ncbi:hypothetical protein PHYSODRAFT_499162 [Phytophthora sojae]|uniref:Uncharacterized protein n=1 Tax=Phytophthora sojae (strain P6497) TaxID=1094619 RepID=G4ZH26_PHYSP|nr:hypothetical protein PHYSODRAFT_499162 [Phytophthora sojae]EGZ18651.1 hypothetical protein PHYSODRAFT_499162 [Phytophthora sojae]|eukprot:XP_009527709.1 hypothetical protein PHYSODRAFT_499162 [Phytophthora sojae]